MTFTITVHDGENWFVTAYRAGSFTYTRRIGADAARRLSCRVGRKRIAWLPCCLRSY